MEKFFGRFQVRQGTWQTKPTLSSTKNKLTTLQVANTVYFVINIIPVPSLVWGKGNSQIEAILHGTLSNVWYASLGKGINILHCNFKMYVHIRFHNGYPSMSRSCLTSEVGGAIKAVMGRVTTGSWGSCCCHFYSCQNIPIICNVTVIGVSNKW